MAWIQTHTKPDQKIPNMTNHYWKLKHDTSVIEQDSTAHYSRILLHLIK